MKTALVHDWLVTLGGAERVLDAIFSIYPSPIYTLVEKKGVFNQASFSEAQVMTSFIQKLPFAKRAYRNYLPFFPKAIEGFDLSPYDVVISSSHAVAKGVKVQETQMHVCYCHTPMRYAWDLYEQYMSDLNGAKELLARWTLGYLRKWDAGSAGRVTHFVANSRYIAERIKRIYGREATVIYPPVQTDAIKKCENKDNFYLTMSRLVPYKRIDLVVEAFSHLPDKKLCVIGDGPEMNKIKRLAGRNVEILGYQSDSQVKDYLARAKALIFAAEEDFGIIPVEAQAAGTPVIAFGKGGALETVIEGETGLFFSEQTVKSIIEAIEKFEKLSFNPERICQQAHRFNAERFKQEFKQFVESKWEEFCESYHFSRG
jgi:glycosyltransferase involved in cell wall biosynthesis